MLRLVQENPYAPSMVDQTRVAPASRGWQIVDGRLLVEPEAILPMIDPYTGESSERMTAIRLGLQRRVRWPRYLMLGGMLLVFTPSAFDLGDGWGVAGLLLFLGGLFAWVMVPATLGHLPLFVFVGPGNDRRKRKIRYAMFGILAAIAGLAVLAPNLPGINASHERIPAGLVILLVLGLLLLRWTRRRLYWRPAPDGRREITGVHPQAMELLRKEPEPTARS